MTASAKKKPAKKPAKKKAPAPAGKTKSEKQYSWAEKAILIVVYWVLGAIALGSMGMVGRFLNEAGTYVFGSFFYVLILTGMAWTIWYVFTRGKKKLPARMYWGYICLALFWVLACALGATDPDVKMSAFTQLQQQMVLFQSGMFFSSYGIIGALIAGILIELISRTGLLLVILALFFLGVCLMFWTWIRMLLLSPRDPSGAAQKIKNTAARLSGRNEDEPQTSVSEPAIFANGIAADFSDEPLEPLADPETISQPTFDDVAAEELFEKPEDPKRLPKRKSRKSRKAEPAPEPQAAPVSDALPVSSSLEGYRLPPASLLEDVKSKNSSANVRSAREQGARLIEILRQFNVDASLGDIHIGPTVTEFEIIPGTGVRVNTFVNLQNDIKMALAAKDIRVEAPIPGKSAVGIEVPNVHKSAVSMKELFTAFPAELADKPLAFCLGKDLTGTNIYGRLDTMPHLLIAGATGSGKSVCVNAIICSLLMRTRPDEVKLLLVDPKKVEFTQYNDIPHLLAPVITDAALANSALKVICQIMDERYDQFKKISARNLSAYNEHVRRHPEDHLIPMPRVVVIIDELADLMTTASKEVEQSIQRITQLARAAGIHLIVATQRPSVNVITGTIKSNIPSRIAFMVSSRIDAKTILDAGGAEKLLGHGDMFFEDNGATAPKRIQGVFIQDQEVDAICEFVKSQAAPEYNDALIELKRISTQGGPAPEMDLDPLYERVREMVVREQKASTSQIQRFFHIGYGRAASILDQLESNQIIGPSNGTRPRDVLVKNNYEEDMEDADL